jgi:hypothetical protein
MELMIRFMLVRPLIQGAFLSDEWADILTARIATGQTARDRELVPGVLRQWGLDVTKIRTEVSKVLVWEFTEAKLFPNRHNYVHRYEAVPEEIAVTGLECAGTFRHKIVYEVAKQIGFSLDITGKWCKIEYPKVVNELSGSVITTPPDEYEPANPFK